ncbi:gamma-glutamylcyclotransferase [Burkholderia lata]|nr:gamma-glutamylcyclotransferase [Burkholderia lata]
MARRVLFGKVRTWRGPYPRVTDAYEETMTTNRVVQQAFAYSEEQNSSPTLTRQLLEEGSVAALAAIDSPGMRMLTESERSASLRETLAARPAGDIWVFGYGSLIWNAAIDAVERRVARVDGWHRSFCLSITALRATADRPGLMLALDRGGSCHGAAYRLAEANIERELQLLWRREMVCGAYVPRWVDLKGISGEAIGSAIAFTIDTTVPQYAGHLEHDVVVRKLATASGTLGSARDYLFRTCEGLRASGLRDAALEHLAASVRIVHADGLLSVA